jgi:hypothetical protein
MNQMLIQKTSVKFVVVVSVLLLVQTSLVVAADDITGDWEITMESSGRQSFAMVNISKNAGGSLAGTWGNRELSDVKFQDGKLTFNRTVGPPDMESIVDYKGTLKDDKLMLTMSSDWGEFPAVGARPKPKCPILGQWDMNFNVGDRDINARLIISQKPDGALTGEWTKEQGEHIISDIKFKDGKLTFTRKSKLDEFEFETYYEGVLKNHDLTGMFKNEMGQWQVSGKRFGVELVGEWELTVTSDWGTRTSTMKIFGDLTGRYGFFDSELPMKDIKLDGGQVTFRLEMGWGDQTFDMDFKGKLDGAKLEGQLISDMGISDVIGKKVEKVAPVAPASDSEASGN